MPTEKEISQHEEENALIVNRYLALRLKKGLPGCMPTIFYKSEYEPFFEITIKHTPGKSVDAFKDFIRDINVVLNGKCVIGKDVKDIPPGGVYRNPEIKFSVLGNPAHMIDDIRRRDPERLPASKPADSTATG